MKTSRVKKSFKFSCVTPNLRKQLKIAIRYFYYYLKISFKNSIENKKQTFNLKMYLKEKLGKHLTKIAEMLTLDYKNWNFFNETKLEFVIIFFPIFEKKENPHKNAFKIEHFRNNKNISFLYLRRIIKSISFFEDLLKKMFSLK